MGSNLVPIASHKSFLSFDRKSHWTSKSEPEIASVNCPPPKTDRFLEAEFISFCLPSIRFTHPSRLVLTSFEFLLKPIKVRLRFLQSLKRWIIFWENVFSRCLLNALAYLHDKRLCNDRSIDHSPLLVVMFYLISLVSLGYLLSRALTDSWYTPLWSS